MKKGRRDTLLKGYINNKAHFMRMLTRSYTGTYIEPHAKKHWESLIDSCDRQIARILRRERLTK